MSTPAETRLPTLAGRIRLSLLSVTLFGIAVVTATALAIGYHSMERHMRSQLDTLATITAEQGQAPLLFKDRAAALDVLGSIPQDQGVRLAELRDESGTVVARVVDEAQTLPGVIAGAFDLGAVTKPVVVDGRKVGSVTLVSGGKPLMRSLLGFLAFDLIAALLTAAVVLGIGRGLTQHVTDPLTELGAVIRRVREDRDYGRRAPASGFAELDELRADFNALLDEIQRRDQELSRTNSALKRLALRDTLTGLPNRAMFEGALLEALRADDTNEGRVGLLYFDLDSFKAVNDNFGHPAGDALLRAIAARLEAHLPADALPARIGGDEFVVLLRRVDGVAALQSFAERLQAVLQAPLDLGTHVLHPGLSIGHALSPGRDAEADALIHLADQAMYVSKSRRREAGVRTRWEALPRSDERGMRALFEQTGGGAEPAARAGGPDPAGRELLQERSRVLRCVGAARDELDVIEWEKSDVSKKSA